MIELFRIKFLLKKILIILDFILDYFLVKFEIISSSEVKWASNEIGRQFLKNSEKLWNSDKKIGT